MATSLSAGLSKVFVGPCGTVTRLHQDCANAHAWLGQASGRKLFVCYPPSDAEHLDVLGGKRRRGSPGSIRSRPEDRQPRGYLRNATPTVFVLEPGEVVLVPLRVVALRGGAGLQRHRHAQLLHRDARVEPHEPGAHHHRKGEGVVSVAEFVRPAPRRRSPCR